eukprot:5921751-Prymnesium_polylepis.1
MGQRGRSLRAAARAGVRDLSRQRPHQPRDPRLEGRQREPTQHVAAPASVCVDAQPARRARPRVSAADDAARAVRHAAALRAEPVDHARAAWAVHQAPRDRPRDVARREALPSCPQRGLDPNPFRGVNEDHRARTSLEERCAWCHGPLGCTSRWPPLSSRMCVICVDACALVCTGSLQPL